MTSLYKFESKVKNKNPKSFFILELLQLLTWKVLCQPQIHNQPFNDAHSATTSSHGASPRYDGLRRGNKAITRLNNINRTNFIWQKIINSLLYLISCCSYYFFSSVILFQPFNSHIYDNRTEKKTYKPQPVQPMWYRRLKPLFNRGLCFLLCYALLKAMLKAKDDVQII